MTPTASACAYVRKSVKGREDMDRSMDNQTAAIAALAERDHVAIGRVYDGDWGRSAGRSSRAKRSAMAELIEAIRAGDVSALYAYSLDRLARDVEYAMTLWNACADQGVPIIVDGMRYDTSDGQHEFFYTMTAAQARAELVRITDRNRAIKARAKVNGTSLGGKLVYGKDPRHPDEHPEYVTATYQRLGTFLGTARELTARGFTLPDGKRVPVSTRHGKPWTVRSVAVLVRRELDLPEAPARAGISAKHTRIFTGILACHCGSILTSMPRSGRHRTDGTIGPGSIAYYCRAAHLDARHSKPYMVSEPKVLAWVKANLLSQITGGKLRGGSGARQAVAPPSARRAITTAERDRKRLAIANAVVDGVMSREESQVEIRKLNAQSVVNPLSPEEMDAYVAHAASTDAWQREAHEINADLRRVFGVIHLGRDMLPLTRAEAVA